MLALDANTATVMYAYDPVAGAWNKLTPATLPPRGRGRAPRAYSSIGAML